MSNFVTQEPDRNVLVIDEHVITRSILEDELSSAGCRVIQAETVQQGVNMALTHLPDIITVDLALNGSGGL